MRAWTHERRGAPNDVLVFQHAFPKATASDLKEGEALLRVSHVSLFAPNANLMAVLPVFSGKPQIPENLFAGTITAVAKGTPTSLHAGDEVFGIRNPKKTGYNGVLAEYIILPVEAIVRQPDNVSAAVASGLAGNGATVIGFAERAGLLEIVESAAGPSIVGKAGGKRILVVGGSTATGQFAIQIMRYLVGQNGSVVAMASKKNEQVVRDLGADSVIDYSSLQSLPHHLASEYSSLTMKFDTIVDVVGDDPELYIKSPAYLHENGYFIFGGKMAKSHAKPSSSLFGALVFIVGLVVTVLTWFMHEYRPVVLGGVPRKCFFHSGNPSQRNLQLVQQLASEGVLNGVIDSEYSMNDLLKAYEHLAKDRICGRVVIKVQEDEDVG